MTLQSRVDNFTKGRIFTAEFIKADGTLRHMVCRTGVTKHLRGGSRTSDPDQVVIVFDMQKKAYRSFRADRLLQFKCGSDIFKFPRGKQHDC